MKRLLVAAALAACLTAGAVPAYAVQAAQPADDRPDIMISPADRDLAIGNLIAAIRAQYYSVAEGARISRAIERNRHRYAAIASGRQLAASLT